MKELRITGCSDNAEAEIVLEKAITGLAKGRNEKRSMPDTLLQNSLSETENAVRVVFKAMVDEIEDALSK